MTGTWSQKPTPIVEFAPANTTTGTPFSPWNKPASGDWDALTTSVAGVTTTRLLSFDNQRGRSDVVENFDAGTATFVLDNNDGQLDEFKSGSLTEANKGGPLTPIRFRLTNAYTGTTSTIWSGFITDGWEPSPPGSRNRTVTVRAIDFMGWAARRPLPKSPLTVVIKSADPEIWWRGRLTSHRITGSTGGYSAGAGGFAFDQYANYDTSGGIVGQCVTVTEAVEMAESIIPDDDVSPSMRWHIGSTLRSYTAASTSPTSWGFICAFQVRDTSTFGRDLVVARVTSSAASNRKWRVRIGTTGAILVEQFDAAGASLRSATLSTPHNDGQPHIVYGRFAPTSVDVYTDLGHAGFSGAGTPAGSGGWLSTSANTSTDVRVLVQEWSYFDSDIVTDVPDLASVLEGKPQIAPDTSVATRLAEILNQADMPAAAAGFFTQYVTATTEYVGAYPLVDNLASAIEATGEALAGGSFTTRSGNVQVFTFGNMTDAYFATSSATFSNDPTATSVVRFTGTGRSGRLIDRVINQVDANGAVLAKDQTSIDTWGLQPLSIGARPQSDAAHDYADDIIALRKDPSAELGEVTIRPWGNQTATTWLLETCDLGRRVFFVEYSPDASYVTIFAGYNVQSESWSWTDGTDWSVTLKLA